MGERLRFLWEPLLEPSQSVRSPAREWNGRRKVSSGTCFQRPATDRAFGVGPERRLDMRAQAVRNGRPL